MPYWFIPKISVARRPTRSFAGCVRGGSFLSDRDCRLTEFAVNLCAANVGVGSFRSLVGIIDPILVRRHLASTVDGKRHNTTTDDLGSNCWPVVKVPSIRRGRCHWAGIGATTQALYCLAL